MQATSLVAEYLGVSKVDRCMKGRTMKQASSSKGQSGHSENLSYPGAGKVSVPVSKLLNSGRLQEQVNAAREIQQRQREGKK